MSDAKKPDYRITAFVDGEGPTLESIEGRERRVNEGKAWSNQNPDETKTFLRGEFTLSGGKPSYKFKAYPSNPTDVPPGAKRRPDYNLFLLDARGLVPTEPDPERPGETRWKRTCGLWLNRRTDNGSTYLRASFELDGANIVLEIEHIPIEDVDPLEVVSGLKLHFGPLARSLSEQLNQHGGKAKSFEKGIVATWQQDADAIARLALHQLISAASADEARARLAKSISSSLEA